MARIEYFQTSEEAHNIIATARANGECAVMSNVGVLVGTKQEAMHTFRLTAIERSHTLGDFDIFELVDPYNVPAIGFDVATPQACYLYGVEPNDFALYAADLTGRPN